VTPDSPLEHLLGVDQDALGDAGPQGSMLLKKVEPFMQAHLGDGQLADHREDVNLEAAQNVVVAFLVLLTVGLVPLPEERLDRVGLEDGLLLKEAHDLWVVALLMLRAQALRLAPCLLERHQRIAAEV